MLMWGQLVGNSCNLCRLNLLRLSLSIGKLIGADFFNVYNFLNSGAIQRKTPPGVLRIDCNKKFQLLTDVLGLTFSFVMLSTMECFFLFV